MLIELGRNERRKVEAISDRININPGNVELDAYVDVPQIAS